MIASTTASKAASTDTPVMRRRPFLKWAGGKFRVLDHILPKLPNGTRLVEPFAGSAAVSLNAGFPRALVADANGDLINLYKSVQSDLPRFLAEATALFGSRNTRADFNALRTEFNESVDPLRRSVLFVYLNRHGFNGLCRYNSRGGFNVPFGKYTNPSFPEREVISFNEAAKRIEFIQADFASVMSNTKAGDVIYCDPPYVPLSVTSNFTSYAPDSFGFAQQKALAELARECASRGVPVVISNHDTPTARALYRGAKIHAFAVHRAISSKASTRGAAPELLAVFS
jgi:DNA adenine methylase